VNILSVELDNFLIIQKAVVELNNRGLVHIVGINEDDSTSNSNGSGKSAIIEAVYWGLFGDTLRSLKSVDDVVNNNVGANCCVSVNLEDEGKQIKVTRYRKHTKHKNNLYLYIDEVDSRGKDNRETQEFIEALIGVDKTTFASSIVFGQGYSKNLRRFSELTDKEQKECLEKILELEIFQESFILVKKQILEKNTDLQLCQNDIQNLDTQTTKLQEEIEGIEESCSSHDKDIQTRVEALDESILEIEANIKLVECEIEECVVEGSEEVQEQLQALSEMLESNSQKLAKLQATYLEKRSKLTVIKNGIIRDVKSLQDRKDKLMDPDSEGEDCWYCGGLVLEKNITEKSDGFDFEIKDQQKTLADLDISFEKLENGYKKRQNKISEERGGIKELVAVAEETMSVCRESQRQIAVLEERKVSLEEKKKIKRSQIKEYQGRENPWGKILETKLKELSDLEGKVVEHKEKRDSIFEELKYLEFWKKGFSRQGIRSFMLDKVIPFLNKQANKYLGILTDGGIQIEFNAVKRLASGEYRENFHVAVNNVRAAQTYEGNSGGEKRRIDLAVSLAINDLIAGRSGKRFNILLLDEIFENLDEVGVHYAVKTLEEIAKKKSSVFIITHSEILADVFQNEIVVRRKDGLSTIVN
tara:strand:+ start:4700 stop:6628 length:1929 start_codon:yes stop_codon:yes gene_type:complete